MSTQRGLSQATLIGFALSCSGGPVALATISLIQSAHTSVQLRGLLTAGGTLLFFAPLVIWLRYAREVASPGGLYSFVREAAGQPVALVHGLAWSLSYLLYLAFTAAYIIYFLLPEILPVSKGLQEVAEVGLPVVFSSAVTITSRGTVRFLAALGAVQIAVVVVFGIFAAVGHPAAAPESSGLVTAAGTVRTVGALSLLFVCSSLVLYLGGEARRGRRAIRRSLFWAFLCVAALSIFVSVAVAPWIDRQVNASAIPGFAIALRACGRGVAVAVGIAALLSLGGLILAEFIALGRLWNSMFRWGDRQSGIIIGGMFVLLDIVSLANPYRFYEFTIGPSLVALFLSQLIVFAVYPLFRKKQGKFRPGDGFVTVVAIAWSIFGIYLALSPAPAY